MLGLALGPDKKSQHHSTDLLLVRQRQSSDCGDRVGPCQTSMEAALSNIQGQASLPNTMALQRHAHHQIMALQGLQGKACGRHSMHKQRSTPTQQLYLLFASDCLLRCTGVDGIDSSDDAVMPEWCCVGFVNSAVDCLQINTLLV